MGMNDDEVYKYATKIRSELAYPDIIRRINDALCRCYQEGVKPNMILLGRYEWMELQKYSNQWTSMTSDGQNYCLGIKTNPCAIESLLLAGEMYGDE